MKLNTVWPFYNIVNKKHAIVKGSRLTNYWASRFRRGLCYYIQTHKSQESSTKIIFKGRIALVEHIFGNHEHCTAQCPGKRKAARDHATKIASTAVQPEDQTTNPPLAKGTNRVADVGAVEVETATTPLLADTTVRVANEDPVREKDDEKYRKDE